MIIAAELSAPIRVTSGPAIERAGDLAALLTSLTEGEVLFIDEIHRIARPAEELLYMAMEDFRVDVIVGKGPGATAIPLELAPFTLVGATTRAGLLTGPLRDRFGFTGHMDFYDAAELDRCCAARPTCSASTCATDGAAEIAGRSRGTPRIANRLLRRVRDYAEVRADGVVTQRVAACGARGVRRRPARPRPARPGRARGAGAPIRRRSGRASARSRWPLAKRSRRSRRSPSRSWSAPGCSPARRGDGSPRRPPGPPRTWSRPANRGPSLFDAEPVRRTSGAVALRDRA